MGAVAWTTYPKKDMVVTFSYSWSTLETIGMGLQGTDRVSAVISKLWSVKNQWPSAREWMSRGANSPVLRFNAGQLQQQLLHPYTGTSAQECSLHV